MTARKDCSECPECKDCQIPGGLKVVQWGMSCWVIVVTGRCAPSQDGRVKGSNPKFRVPGPVYAKHKHLVQAMEDSPDMIGQVQNLVRHQMNGAREVSRAAMKVVSAMMGSAQPKVTPPPANKKKKKI